MVQTAAELANQVADVVISYHALEHTLAPYDELAELWRVLKPHGKLVLWLPIDDWRVQRELIDDPDHHLYTWSPQLLRNLLEEAGFVVYECRVVTHAWPPRYYNQLYRALPRWAFNALAWALAVALRRRQLMAVAGRPGGQNEAQVPAC
jgi:SAM-dependent methyltransferase